MASTTVLPWSTDCILFSTGSNLKKGSIQPLAMCREKLMVYFETYVILCSVVSDTGKSSAWIVCSNLDPFDWPMSPIRFGLEQVHDGVAIM